MVKKQAEIGRRSHFQHEGRLNQLDRDISDLSEKIRLIEDDTKELKTKMEVRLKGFEKHSKEIKELELRIEKLESFKQAS